ncbi:unnamed protein product [Rotaria socialis]|uniref:Uncharacterized protein n=1 Tax=Rotaria socialis TaxID=392032 RepID=A0A817Z0I2_9BILA|nr:unnamed protein product [Rotaria socialis]CAF4637083.1 unnamed protein product [Rotaria socialis]
MGNTQSTDVYIAEPQLSDLCDSRSLLGIWRDTKHGYCMRFDDVYDRKLNRIAGLSSTGAQAQACLTGAIVDLKLTLSDNCSSYYYKGLLEISNDDQQTHTIRWTKKNIKTGQWYLTSSWVKI